MNTNAIVLFIFFIGIHINLISQGNCEILDPNLKGQYEGECKKGLASGEGVAIGINQYEGVFRKGLPHGYGVYKWATGEIYEGEWNKGLRNGIGKYMVQINEDSLMIFEGIWEKDKYIGKEDSEPKVFDRKGIDHYSFRRIGDGNSFEFKIFKNGLINGNLANIWAYPSSGRVRYSAGSFKIDTPNYPLSCTVNYWSWDELVDRRIQSVFKFEIPESGDWIVEIHHY